MEKATVAIDQPVPGYLIWCDPSRANPWRWAAERADSKGMLSYGGAKSFSAAIVAAESHKACCS